MSRNIRVTRLEACREFFFMEQSLLNQGIRVICTSYHRSNLDDYIKMSKREYLTFPSPVEWPKLKAGPIMTLAALFDSIVKL